MKLIFFDIECAGVHKTYAKICAFGYVVCDGQFNILEKEDILINPRGRFELTNRKGEKGIILPYEYSEFKKQPSFPAVYERIKALLEDKNTYVFGHAVLNDVKYLNLETRRFKLPSFRFRFNDSQLLFMAYKNDFSRQFGLEFIASELGVEFTPHRAADDAYATMRIVEAMCKVNNCGLEELLKLYRIKSGKIENYNIIRPLSEGLKGYERQRKSDKEQRSRARIKFNNYYLKKRFVRGGRLGGATFTFTRAIEDDISVSLALVDKIYANGGRYTQQVEACAYFVRTEGDISGRAKAASSRSNVKMLEIADLERLLND